MNKKQLGNSFLRCLPFGPVLALVVVVSHILVTALFQSALAIFPNGGIDDVFGFIFLSTYFVFIAAAVLALPFSLILFIPSMIKRLKPALNQTVKYTLFWIVPLDLLNNLLMHLFPKWLFHFYGVSVILTFFACLVIAVLTAGREERPR
jgi:hypothetical protein